MLEALDTREWLEADGLGGFASGTVSGVRTRRYHAWLLASLKPPSDRRVLLNGAEVHLEIEGEVVPISTHWYAPGVAHPDGASRIVSFEATPWPTWRHRIRADLELRQELFVVHGSPVTAVRWSMAPHAGATLVVRPLLSGRDYHALHHENTAFDFSSEVTEGRVRWKPYPSEPAVEVHHDGTWVTSPDWYRSFLYEQERMRGLDDGEDLASPGELRFDLARGEAVCIFSAVPGESSPPEPTGTARQRFGRLRTREKRRRSRFATALEAAADAYLVRRGQGITIIAGYPWFTDWGRDTFLAVRGLCLATGRLAEAREILAGWADTVSEGMLPNRFPDQGEAPEYNSVDASLWYVVAVGELLEQSRRSGHPIRGPLRARLTNAVRAILEGYAAGTRYGIVADRDGLLRAGVPGEQLTWMDARIDGWVVTPRVGKPVEIQALWINALEVGGRFDDRWVALRRRAEASFQTEFWNEAVGGLFDVVDVDHEAGRKDPTVRPNQILAVGGLPRPLVAGTRGRRIVDLVESLLLTPLGLRSLAPVEPGYSPRYEGGPRERDGVYHQGTVWPWLLGPFVEAWLNVRGGTDAARREARSRFLTPLLEHLEVDGIGHVCEIADAEAPHTPRGCPFQAWSLAELLRLDRSVLAKPLGAAPPRSMKGRGA